MPDSTGRKQAPTERTADQQREGGVISSAPDAAAGQAFSTEGGPASGEHGAQTKGREQTACDPECDLPDWPHDGPCKTRHYIELPGREQACAFYWTIRNHPRFDECSDQWCAVHDAWRREELPRDVCEAVMPATAREQA